MNELFYAGIIVIITGIVGICIGIFDLVSKKEKPRGFGNLTVHFKVKDVIAYNHAVGKLWLITGLLICLDGALLLLPDPETRSVFVALTALAIYTISSVCYVMIIEKKYGIQSGENKYGKK